MANEFDTLPIPHVYQPDLARSVFLTGVGQVLVAAGSVVGDATLVTAETSLVSAADGTKGVRLPADAAGRTRVIVNTGASTLKVWPPTGADIDGGTVNTAVTVGAGLAAVFLFTSATKVKSLAVGTPPAASPINSAEVTFTEIVATGVYTGSVSVPAGATILDVIVNGDVLWAASVSATMKVGDVADDDGYYTAVNLKATDLLAGESISFALAGGKAGAYIANSQVSPRYSATARTVSGIVTTVDVASGGAGRTRMTVIYSSNTATAAVKV